MASEKFNKAAKEMVEIMDKTVKTMESERKSSKKFEEWLKNEIEQMEDKPENGLNKALMDLQIEANEINEEFAKLRDEIVYVDGVDNPVDGRRVAQLIDRYFKCLNESQRLSIALAQHF